VHFINSHRVKKAEEDQRFFIMTIPVVIVGLVIIAIVIVLCTLILLVSNASF
jgi:hypothetical protein